MNWMWSNFPMCDGVTLYHISKTPKIPSHSTHGSGSNVSDFGKHSPGVEIPPDEYFSNLSMPGK